MRLDVQMMLGRADARLLGWWGAGNWVPCTPYHVTISAALIVAAVHCRNSMKKKLDILGRDLEFVAQVPKFFMFHVARSGWHAHDSQPLT